MVSVDVKHHVSLPVHTDSERPDVAVCCGVCGDDSWHQYFGIAGGPSGTGCLASVLSVSLAGLVAQGVWRQYFGIAGGPSGTGCLASVLRYRWRA